MNRRPSFMGCSSDPMTRMVTSPSAGKQTALQLQHHQGRAGNMTMLPQGFQGLQAPVPSDDFEKAPTPDSVCRAASNSAPAGTLQMEHCAGDSSQHHLQHLLQNTLNSGEPSNKSAGTFTLVHEDMAPSQENTFAQLPHTSASDGPSFGHRSPKTSQRGKAPMQSTFASTTECILQNLTMTVGNPSARCYANAPWRAFTWTCALLQETNTQPWGNLQAAVQESLKLAEAVDIHELPGLPTAEEA